MLPSQPSESELLKTVLEPLLEDFQYWFGRSRTLLENNDLDFLSDEEQTQLLERINNAIAEVDTAKMLFQATDGKVGIETKTMMPWHALVTECWQVAMKWHSTNK